MAHKRQQIRERIATTLTGLTTTGSNDFQSRVYNIEENKLPCLLIYTKDETSEPISHGYPRTLLRLLTVNIEAYCKQNNNFDDTIDDITKEVEEAIYGDRLINNLAKDSFIISTEIDYNREGDNPIGYVTMTFQVEYHVEEGSIG